MPAEIGLNCGRTSQRTLLYPDENYDQQRMAWRMTLVVFHKQQKGYANLGLFPDDRALPAEGVDNFQVRPKRAGTQSGAAVRELVAGQ